jgi:hypothetical protein
VDGHDAQYWKNTYDQVNTQLQSLVNQLQDRVQTQAQVTANAYATFQPFTNGWNRRPYDYGEREYTAQAQQQGILGALQGALDLAKRAAGL